MVCWISKEQEVEHGERREKERVLVDIHYFRAFAILNVVLVHIWQLPAWAPKVAWEWKMDTVRSILFHDSTIYFIFISGFLFHYLSSSFNLVRYYKGKIFNVIIPYVLISCLFFALEPLATGATSFAPGDNLLYNLIAGKTQIQFWYIPFITLVFIISPLLLMIPQHVFVKLSLVFMVVPLAGTRTDIFVSVGQYLYFFPVYCFGIACSMYYDEFVAMCDKLFVVALAVAFVASGLLYALCIEAIHLGVFFNIESVYFVQKMAILFVVVKALQIAKRHRFKSLNLLADYSFALYFMHIWVWAVLCNLTAKFLSDDASINWLLVSTALTLVSIVLALSLAMGLRKALGRYSRMLIGA